MSDPIGWMLTTCKHCEDEIRLEKGVYVDTGDYEICIGHEVPGPGHEPYLGCGRRSVPDRCRQASER
jgi:hypothetical protein